MGTFDFSSHVMLSSVLKLHAAVVEGQILLLIGAVNESFPFFSELLYCDTRTPRAGQQVSSQYQSSPRCGR